MSVVLNKYFVVQFDKNFDKIENINVYRDKRNFVETLDFLKNKISKEISWELISSKSESFIYIEYLYQFKHTTNLKDLLEEIEDIHRTLENNLSWIHDELKENK